MGPSTCCEAPRRSRASSRLCTRLLWALRALATSLTPLHTHAPPAGEVTTPGGRVVRKRKKKKPARSKRRRRKRKRGRKKGGRKKGGRKKGRRKKAGAKKGGAKKGGAKKGGAKEGDAQPGGSKESAGPDSAAKPSGEPKAGAASAPEPGGEPGGPDPAAKPDPTEEPKAAAGAPPGDGPSAPPKGAPSTGGPVPEPKPPADGGPAPPAGAPAGAPGAPADPGKRPGRSAGETPEGASSPTPAILEVGPGAARAEPAGPLILDSGAPKADPPTGSSSATPAEGAAPKPGETGAPSSGTPKRRRRKRGRKRPRKAPKPLPEPKLQWVEEPQPVVPMPGRRLSELVYPPARFRIRVDHASHAGDLETPCLECHRSVLGSRRVRDRNLPNHIPCQDCHISDDPADIECNQCHGKATPGHPRRRLVPSPRLRFSHRAHLARALDLPEDELPDLKPLRPLKERTYGEFIKAWALPPEIKAFKVPDSTCLSCHSNGQRAGVDERVRLPGMQTDCFACHDNQQATRRCSLCHPEAPDAPLRDGGVGWRALGLLPRSHGAHWLEEHRDEARLQRSTCEGCHHRADCVRCHEGQVRPDFHPANWVLAHGLRSRYASQQCSVCHTQQRCQSCHSARGVTGSTFPGSWQSIFHPQGWMSLSSSRHHGIAGRRDLLSCTSCHREADCSKGGCHR